MADFETMYYRLFNHITDAIRILQQAQQEGEERFMSAGCMPSCSPPDEDKRG